VITNSNPEQPLVSVGLPTYNRPKLLHQALECLTKQSYKNLEIIVSDDGFPGEETQKVVQEFMEKDPRIKYYRQEKNLGPSRNHRFVLERATGEYFMWASDDDLWRPNFISELVDLLEASPSAVLSMCRAEKIDYNGLTLKLGPLYLTTTGMTRAERLRYFSQLDSSWLFCGLYRIEIPRTALALLDDERLRKCAGDVLFMRKCIDSGDLVFTDEVLFFKRQSGPNPLDGASLLEMWRMVFLHCYVAFFTCYHLGGLSLREAALVYLASIQGLRKLSFYHLARSTLRRFGANLLRKATSALKAARTHRRQ